LELNDIDFEYISKAKVLHVSGHSLSQNPARKAIISAVKYAKENGVKISFDPTLRPDCWNSEVTIKKMYTQMLRIADIATFSEEESKFMFGTTDPVKVAEKALEFGVNIVGVKQGPRGCFVKSKNGTEIFAPAFKVDVIDTTGAGDGWDAGLLVSLLRGFELKECATIANAVGALVVTKRGAITALPYKDELNKFLMHHNIKLKI
jgi:sugar/nucleoside kinase (ribokinase family)